MKYSLIREYRTNVDVRLKYEVIISRDCLGYETEDWMRTKGATYLQMSYLLTNLVQIILSHL